MPWIGPALGIGGSLISGAFGGAKDPGPSASQQNSRYDALNQAGRYNDAFYGDNWRGGSGPSSAGAWDWINAGDPTNFSNFRYGGPARSGGASASGGGVPGSPAGGAPSGGGGGSLYGGNTPYGTLPILQQLQLASQAGQTENNRSLQDFNQGSESAYRQAQQFGTGQQAVINSDAAKSLSNANARSSALLNRSGLGGSTLATDAIGANAAGNFREKARATADLADRATGLKIQQRNQATSGRAALSGQINSSNQNLRMMPINGQLNAMSSPIANPFSVQGGQAPATAQNGMLNSLGNTTSQLGGLYLAQSLYGGGGGGSSGGGGAGGYGSWGGRARLMGG